MKFTKLLITLNFIFIITNLNNTKIINFLNSYLKFKLIDISMVNKKIRS